MVNHHRPLEGERTARAVYLADAVAHDLDGGEPPAPPSELTVVVLGSLGMGVDDWSPIVLDARHRARLVAAAQTG